jgi:hypothetical protein
MKMGSDQTPPRRFRIRLSTMLFVVAIAALMAVVGIQQMQSERLRRSLYTEQQRSQKLADIIREQRDYIERHKAAPAVTPSVPLNSQPGR